MSVNSASWANPATIDAMLFRIRPIPRVVKCEAECLLRYTRLHPPGACVSLGTRIIARIICNGSDRAVISNRMPVSETLEAADGGDDGAAVNRKTSVRISERISIPEPGTLIHMLERKVEQGVESPMAAIA